MCKVGRKNKKAGLFIKKKKKLEDPREAKDVLVALVVTLTFCSPTDVRTASAVRVINLPRRFNKHLSACVCVCTLLCGQINQNALLQSSVIRHDVGLRYGKMDDSAHFSPATRVTGTASVHNCAFCSNVRAQWFRGCDWKRRRACRVNEKLVCGPQSVRCSWSSRLALLA